MSSIIVFKIDVPVDSHWELQFSNLGKGLKFEENDPPIPPLSEGWLWEG